jgi:hypothetical protein
MEFAGISMKDKFDEDARPMSKEVSSSKEDFELFYEKDLGVILLNLDHHHGYNIRWRCHAWS